MNPSAEFDIIVYGATGYTGRLVAEYLAQRYGVGGLVSWAMAGRSAGKLAQVRDELNLPAETPVVVADADNPDSLEAMVRRARAVVTTVGPYQLYGDGLIRACAEAGVDYLDLCGEPNWMYGTVRALHERARETGARLVHSCGFDSIPFELGVWFCEETARARLGHYVPRVKGRLIAVRGGPSGGTVASGAATMAAVQKDPSLFRMMIDPFALTPGFQGPEQPTGTKVERDEDLDADVGPFVMAVINTKNIHRSNALMGHPWGEDFVYDEMAVVRPEEPAAFALGGDSPPKPGEGPTRAEREDGFYDIAFIGLDRDGARVRVSVQGDMDPGYGSTSKILAEAAICLVKSCQDAPGGVWTPGALMGGKLVDRLSENAGLTFTVSG